MADIAGPNILSVVRKNGYQIEITFELGASGMNKIYADVRTMTSGWAQGNAEDLPGSNVIVVSARAGVQLDAKVDYQVKLRARHSSNQPVAESGTANVGAWEVPTPTLLSATRPNPTTIELTYDNVVTAGGAALYVDRRATPSGTWQRYTTFTPNGSGTGKYSILATPASQSFEVRILSGQYGVYSGESSPRSVNAFEVPIPTVASVARSGQTFATIAYTGAVVGAQLVVEFRRAGSLGAFTARTSNPASTSGNYTLTGLDGTLAYEVQAYTIQGDAASGRSSSKALEAWFSLPASVSDLSAARQVDGTVDLTWTGSPTTRAPYAGQRVLRAEGELGQLTLLPAGSIVYTRRTFWDGTAKPEKEYRYTVVPFNDAGEATSRPVVKSNAIVLVPNAPSATTAVWVSDTTADVSWPNPATSDRPVASFVVRRWLLGKWSTVSPPLSGSTLAWRDTGLAKNGVYKYQVQAVNAAGVSAAYSPDSADVVTTPTGASSLTAARSGVDVKLTWVAPSSTIASSWTIERTTATPATPSSTWFPVSAGTLTGPGRQMIDTSVPTGVPLTYRIRPTLAGAPAAPNVQSSTISPYSAPNAPTLLPVYPFDASGVIRLGIVHNPTDGTAMSAANIDYRVNGGAWVSNEPYYPNTWWDIPAGTFVNGSLIEWRAKTEGNSGGMGPYATGSFVARARPVVAITSPTGGAVVESATVTLGWDTASQSSYIVRLIDSDGNVVDTQAGNSSAARTVTFTGLSDRHTYTGSVVVRDAYQESLPATVTFSVELDRPAPPLLTAVPSPEDGTVLLTATAVQGLKKRRTNLLASEAGFESWNLGGTGMKGVSFSDGSFGADVFSGSGTLVFKTVASGKWLASVDVADLDSGSAFRDVSFALPMLPQPGPGVDSQSLDFPAWKRIGGNTPGADVTATIRLAGLRRTALRRPLLSPWDGSLPGSGDYAYFDGDTRSDDYQYGWNPDGTAWEAMPTSDPAEADFSVAPTTRIEIIRVNPDGTSHTLGDVDADGQLTDQLPPLGVRVRYIARAWTDAPAYTDSKPETVQLDGTGVIVNWGPGWAMLATAYLELSFDTSTSSDVELVHFDRETEGGQPNLPVPYGAGTDTHTASVQAVLADEHGSDEDQWGRVPKQLVTWYRDTAGRSFPASIPAVNIGHPYNGKRNLSFTASGIDSNGWFVAPAPLPDIGPEVSTFDFADYFTAGVDD